MVFDGQEVLPTLFLDMSALVSRDFDRGLLSLAFHPRYRINGYFYVIYTNLKGYPEVARYQVSDDPNRANPDSRQVLLTVPTSAYIHLGDHLAFGPDGYLYISVGDGGVWGDPENRAQRLDDLGGKLLRIDVDSGSPYAIPATNPFVGTPGARGEIWARGFRNPWRFNFDRMTGDLFIGDVGDERREELDFQLASSPGGENYGWHWMEGSLCFDPPSDCNDGSLTLPLLEYPHTPEYCAGSITAGYRYRGTQFPQLTGTLFYADFCSGQVWGARDDEGVWTPTELLDTEHWLASFGEDEAGELYLVDYVNGELLRLEVTNTAAPVVTALTPSQVPGGASSLMLGLEGNNFVPGSRLRWNGTYLPTTYVSRTRLTSSVSVPDIARPGTVEVAVVNPPPGGGASNLLTFTITDFVVNVRPPQTRLRRGDSLSVPVAVMPQGGPYDGWVALSCASPLAGLSCTVSPAEVQPGTVGVTSTLTISWEGAAMAPPTQSPPLKFLYAVWLGACLTLGLFWRALVLRGKRPFSPVGAVGLLLLALLGCSCAEGPVSRQEKVQSVTLVVRGISGSLERSVEVILALE